MVSSSVFLGFHIYFAFSQHELIWSRLLLNFTNAGISNETLLALLALLVAFAGLLSFMFKRLVHEDLKLEIYELAQEERIASKIETRITLSYVFLSLYEITESLSKGGEATKELHEIFKKII